MLTDVSCTGYTGGGTGAGALDSNGVPINWNFTAAAGNAVECSYVNSAERTTRTQGFWATHTALTNSVWNGVSIGLNTSRRHLVWMPRSVPTRLTREPGGQALLGDHCHWHQRGTGRILGKLANKTSGLTKKRSDLDKVRMQMLQQYLG